MMEQYSGDFLAAVDGLRRLLGCSGNVWPVTTEQATLCAEYEDGSLARGEPEVDAGQREGRTIARVWLEPAVRIHPSAADVDPQARCDPHRSGQLLYEPDAHLHGERRARGARRGARARHLDREPADGGQRHARVHGRRRRAAHRGGAIGRPVDVLLYNTARPKGDVLARYAAEHKHPLPLGPVDPSCEVICGPFWTGEFARHDRRRLAYATWGVLAKRLLH